MLIADIPPCLRTLGVLWSGGFRKNSRFCAGIPPRSRNALRERNRRGDEDDSRASCRLPRRMDAISLGGPAAPRPRKHDGRTAARAEPRMPSATRKLRMPSFPVGTRRQPFDSRTLACQRPRSIDRIRSRLAGSPGRSRRWRLPSGMRAATAELGCPAPAGAMHGGDRPPGSGPQACPEFPAPPGEE